jgi:hypothetical protein
MTRKLNNVDKAEGFQRHRVPVVNTLTFISLGGVLFSVFLNLNIWAVATFARPILASALLAVCDVAVFFVALALAPPVSRVFYFLLFGSRSHRTRLNPDEPTRYVEK